MSIVFSGIKPSGALHLGNYIGAIKQWLPMQDQNNCIFCVVDMHAITVEQNPRDLRNTIREILAVYIACGIDPKKVTLFQQSQVSEHAELAWVLNCTMPVSWLNKMTQFKDKSSKLSQNSISAGLYNYPTLMAADILLYDTDNVPVGEDQKQHIELTRDIAGAFNRRYGKEFFKLPNPVIMKAGARIMSLRDGNSKMSKSDESQMGCIYLRDTKEDIANKIKKAKTDSDVYFEYDKENRPELVNLLNIYSELSGDNLHDVMARYTGLGFGKFKNELADVVINHISPIKKKIDDLMNDFTYLDSIMQKGNEQAKKIANTNFNNVKKIIGFI